jgi:sulfopyruvate decarboxylase subunit alpha
MENKVSGSLTANAVIRELKRCGITHIVWLPDSENGFIYKAMTSDPAMVLIPVCREGESIAVAAGLTLGGKNPVVLHQSTGLFESGDSLRGIGLGFELPLLLLIGYRGWQRNAPITDSAAVYTEPYLKAWGIKYYLVEADEDVGKISQAYKGTHETRKPVAVLIGKEYQQ